MAKEASINTITLMDFRSAVTKVILLSIINLLLCAYKLLNFSSIDLLPS